MIEKTQGLEQSPEKSDVIEGTLDPIPRRIHLSKKENKEREFRHMKGFPAEIWNTIRKQRLLQGATDRV